MNNWALKFAAAVCLTLVASCLVISPSAYAEDFSWGSSVLITNSVETASYTGLDELGRPDWGGGCIYREVYVGNLSSATSNICVFEGSGFRYGILQEPIYFGSYVAYNKSFVIGFPNDVRMYKVRGMPTQRILWTPNSKHLVYRTNSSTGIGNDFVIIKNIRTKLLHITNSDFSRGYELMNNSPELLLKDEQGDATPVGEVASSTNGQWMVAQILPKGVVRINMQDFTKTLFSNYHPAVGLEGVLPDFAISNDGGYVAMVGSQVDARVVVINSACGRPFTMLEHDRTLIDGPDLVSPCFERQLQATVNNIAHNDLDMVRWPRFDYSGSKITALLTTKGSPDIPKEYRLISINSSDYDNRYSTLDYLALGDSYSSGEGDTGKDQFGHKYYRVYTDVNGTLTVPEEKCHISTRSYPYLLARSMSLAFDSPKEWDTVACSGAEVGKDYIQTNDYLGQVNRSGVARLKTVRDIRTYLTMAGESFIPGRLQQLEFVARTQPKALTLTGGGNDVGFSKVIKACVSVIAEESCDYAVTSKKIALTGYAIQGMYDDLVSLYSRIHYLSPQTKIYVLGYPQFVSDKNEKCELNVLLDKTERRFIRSSVIYLNDIIKAAAKKTGVKYIDIENSFGNDLLCGGGDSDVNGVNLNCAKDRGVASSLSIFAGMDECNESYHPNFKGQQSIAHSVNEQTNSDLINYQYCANNKVVCPQLNVPLPSPPSYFASAMDDNLLAANSKYATLASSGYAQKNNASGNFKIRIDSLDPGSQVRIYVMSEPTELGVYAVDSEGVLDIDIPAPLVVPAGYHTLHLEGLTYSGKPIDLWQIVTIYGSSGDIDEDGVSDSADQCEFIPMSGADRDGDGTDDACDLSIDSLVSGSENEARRSGKDGDLIASNYTSTINELRDTPPTGSYLSQTLKNDGNASNIGVGMGILAVVIAVLYLFNRHKKRHQKG